MNNIISNIVSIITQCDSIMQIIALIIIVLFLTGIAILIYKLAIICLKKFSKIDVDLSKDDKHIHLR